MKKLFTLCMALVAALAVQAQSDFPVQYADANGNIIPDGTILTLTEYVEDELFDDDVQVPTNLFVKNMTDGEVQIGGKYTIQTLDNGAFQTCFPQNCVQKGAVGSYETGNGVLLADELKNMQTEWLPAAEGTCRVIYQLLTYKPNPVIPNKWTVDKEGPTVTLNFSYTPTGVAAAKAGKTVSSVAYYDLQGRLLSTPAHGLCIQKTVYADGTSDTRKHMVR